MGSDPQQLTVLFSRRWHWIALIAFLFLFGAAQFCLTLEDELWSMRQSNRQAALTAQQLVVQARVDQIFSTIPPQSSRQAAEKILGTLRAPREGDGLILFVEAPTCKYYIYDEPASDWKVWVRFDSGRMDAYALLTPTLSGSSPWSFSSGIIEGIWSYLAITPLFAVPGVLARAWFTGQRLRRSANLMLALGLPPLAWSITHPALYNIAAPQTRPLCWMALAASAVIAGIGALARRRPEPPPDQPICPTCGYNLRGNSSGICPECGQPIYPRIRKIIRKLDNPNAPTEADLAADALTRLAPATQPQHPEDDKST